MQFTDDERKQYNMEQFESISHSLRLRQHCESLHKNPLHNICITSLRGCYIVTRSVNNVTFCESVPKSSAFLHQSLVFQVQLAETGENE